MTKRTRGTAAHKAALVLGGALLLGSAGPASATAFITSCGYQITAPGTYLLTQNLTCSGDGIDVRASNVHLVLAKHTLTGVGVGVGVLVEGSSAPLTGITVVGGTITGFDTGVTLSRVSGAPIASVVTGVNASGNRLGITLIIGSTNVRVVGNTANNNAFGIIVQRDSTGNILAGNKATGSGGADLSDGNSSCANTWRGNRFATDFEGDGPGKGCIR